MRQLLCCGNILSIKLELLILPAMQQPMGLLAHIAIVTIHPSFFPDKGDLQNHNEPEAGA